jgi:hypothetical protein
MKILVNRCHGGFGLSDEAFEKYFEYKGIDFVKDNEKGFGGGSIYFDSKGKVLTYYNIPRDDLDLIKVVEEFKDKADGNFSKLEIVEIPDDVEWEIEEYDGNEWIAEVHRTW